MALRPNDTRWTAWFVRRKWYALASLGLFICALLMQPDVLSLLSPDRTLHLDTLLSITFTRLFLSVLALTTLFWPDLANTSRRGLLIGLLMLITLGARAVRLNSPYLDQHAHRQTDVATIARNFYEDNPNILWPQVNWQADGPNYVEFYVPGCSMVDGFGLPAHRRAAMGRSWHRRSVCGAGRCGDVWLRQSVLGPAGRLHGWAVSGAQSTLRVLRPGPHRRHPLTVTRHCRALGCGDVGTHG